MVFSRVDAMISIFPKTTSFQGHSSQAGGVKKTSVLVSEESEDALFRHRLGGVVVSYHKIFSGAAILQTSIQSIELSDQVRGLVVASMNMKRQPSQCRKKRKGKKERNKSPVSAKSS